jgi:predicted AAA+ superfamily ATPase
MTSPSSCLPSVPGKALAVIGMRRSGKTCFLSQCMADLFAAGAPRESLLLADFEDAFLIRTTSLATASERQRMVNLRKAYP